MATGNDAGRCGTAISGSSAARAARLTSLASVTRLPAANRPVTTYSSELGTVTKRELNAHARRLESPNSESAAPGRLRGRRRFPAGGPRARTPQGRTLTRYHRPTVRG
jgi:hypothetical protein